MIHYMDGDLIELANNGVFDIIIHGCNCFHTMGAGIAADMSRSFPCAYKADKRTKRGDINKLGTYSLSYVYVDNKYVYDFDNQKIDTKTLSDEPGEPDRRTLAIANAYTQFRPGRDLRVWALAASLVRLTDNFSGYTFGMPLIGCGIAGGKWSEIEEIVNIIFREEKLIVVRFKGRK